jgi:hypothetical protein
MLTETVLKYSFACKRQIHVKLDGCKMIVFPVITGLQKGGVWKGQICAVLIHVLIPTVTYRSRTYRRPAFESQNESRIN